MPFCNIPPFRPHLLFPGGHSQTLAGVYLPVGRLPYRAKRHVVELDDGDRLVLHDDCPQDWHETDRSCLLIHGLAGSHESGYMRRIADKLNRKRVRVFRMDLRGCGAGTGLARWPYHSGRSEDVAAALRHVAQVANRSPTALVGFSLGANMSLKLLGELGDQPCGNLASGMAVCPPVDLAACSRRISERANRGYDRFFVKLLLKQVTERSRLLPDAPPANFRRRPQSLWEFDDQFTAAVCGFGSADNYYRLASSMDLVSRIQIPTLILAAGDDPMIPPDSIAGMARSAFVQVHLTEHGGHLGFVGRGGTDADRRWMDWRVVDWVTAENVPPVSVNASFENTHHR